MYIFSFMKVHISGFALVSQTRIPCRFSAKHDNVTITMARARILSMSFLFATANARQKHTINRKGRETQKVSVYCLFAALTHLLSPYVPHFLPPACFCQKVPVDYCFSFFARNSRRPSQCWAREKNERLVTVSFSFLF